MKKISIIIIIIITFPLIPYKAEAPSTWMPPAPLRSGPQTLKSQLSSAPGPSQVFFIFQMLCWDPAPAPQRRIVGSTLHLTACIHKKAKSLCAQTPQLLQAAQLQTAHMLQQGWRMGGKPELQQMHIQPSWRMESLWLRGFGPSPILGVAVKAKQCSLKQAWLGFLHKCYLWRAGLCEWKAEENFHSVWTTHKP